MKSDKQRVVGVALSYVHLVSNALINLAYVPFLIGNLGDSEYGLYQLMGSLIAYFSVFDFGLSNSIVRFYSLAKVEGDKKKQANILGTSVLIYSIICGVCALVGLGIYLAIDTIFGNSLTDSQLQEAKAIFLIQLANILISLLGKVFNAVVTSEEKFIFLKMMALLQCYLQPIVIFWLVTQQPYAMTVVAIQTLFNVLLNSVVGIYAVVKLRMKIRLYSIDKTLISQMLKLSFSVFIVAITDQIFWKTNQFILGAIVGTVAVAVYSVAAQIYMNYMVISSTIQGVFLPKVTQLVAEGNPIKISELFIRIGKIQYMLLSVVLIAFVAIGRDFVYLWVGDRYGDSFWIALIVMTAMTIDLIQCIGSTVLQARNQYGIRAKVLVATALLNVVGVLAVARQGGVACALVSAVCMALANGPIMNYFYWKIAGLDIKRYWKEIVRISAKLIFVLTISLLIAFFYKTISVASFIVKGAVICTVYATVMRCEIVAALRTLKNRGD